jgi:hypothetical protein
MDKVIPFPEQSGQSANQKLSRNGLLGSWLGAPMDGLAQNGPALRSIGFHLCPSCPLRAAIFRRPAAEILRLGFAALGWPLAAARFAHRAFWARLIFLRAAADKWRLVDPLYTPTKAVSAAFSADNCFSTRSRSCFNCFTIPDKFAILIGPPSAGDCIRGKWEPWHSLSYTGLRLPL